MAEKKVATTNEEVIEVNPEEKTEKIYIPFTGAPNEPETEFFGAMGKSYYVKKGEWVDVPACVADIFHNNEREKKRLRERERAAGR